MDILCDLLERSKDKRCIYHITSLVSGGIFRPWASTFTRPEKWYSIQCLHFIWAHHWLTQIGAFTKIDFIFLLINPQAQFSASWNTFSTFMLSWAPQSEEVCAPYPVTALLTFCVRLRVILWLHKKRRDTDFSIRVYPFLYHLPTVWMRQARAQKLKGAALCLWLWPWLTPGECSCSTVTVIRCHWGKSNPPFWGSSTRSYCK